MNCCWRSGGSWGGEGVEGGEVGRREGGMRERGLREKREGGCDYSWRKISLFIRSFDLMLIFYVDFYVDFFF